MAKIHKVSLIVELKGVSRSSGNGEFNEFESYQLFLFGLKKAVIPDFKGGWGPKVTKLEGNLKKSRIYHRTKRIYVPSRKTSIELKFDPPPCERALVPKYKEIVRGFEERLKDEFGDFQFLNCKMKSLDLIPKISNIQLRNDLEKFTIEIYSLNLAKDYVYRTSFENLGLGRRYVSHEEVSAYENVHKDTERKIYEIIMKQIWKK